MKIRVWKDGKIQEVEVSQYNKPVTTSSPLVDVIKVMTKAKIVAKLNELEINFDETLKVAELRVFAQEVLILDGDDLKAKETTENAKTE